MSEGDLSASLILRRGALARVGLERIALVEAVGELGSITAAAKRMGLSYKGAWDAIQALNNLFDAPLIAASAGGKAGGAATVTSRGHAVIKAFREVEREIGAALVAAGGRSGRRARPRSGRPLLEPGLADQRPQRLARHGGEAGRGRRDRRGRLSLGDGVEIVSVITRRSAEELGLAVGKAGCRPDQVQLRGLGPRRLGGSEPAGRRDR
jgi:molybdate transport system regulatory protein